MLKDNEVVLEMLPSLKGNNAMPKPLKCKGWYHRWRGGSISTLWGTPLSGDRLERLWRSERKKESHLQLMGDENHSVTTVSS